MTKDVKIGVKTINLTANGATPLFYKQFFHKDLLKEISTSDDGLVLANESVPELAFIMAKQSDKADMLHLTQDMYVEFLSLFDALDLPLAGSDIFGVYVANAMPTEEAKKKSSGKAKE